MEISRKIRRRLGHEGLRRIEAALERAQAGTSGKLAAVVAWQSDSYPEAPWQGAVLAAGAACLALGLADWRYPLWQPLPRLLAAILAAAACGALAGQFVPPLRRKLIGRERLRAMVQRRADEAFLHKGLSQASGRNGILIFVSLFERRAVVVADAGIHAKVGAEEWDRAVVRVIDSARQDGVADGVVEAVGHCHELLLKHGFAAAAGEGA